MKNKITAIILIFIVVAGLAFTGYFLVGYFQEKNAEEETTTSSVQPVLYFQPEGQIYTYEKQKVTMTICAFTDSEVSVKFGTNEFEAEKTKDNGDGTALFTAECKMPKTKAEIESINYVKILCTYNGETINIQGPQVIYDDSDRGKTTTAVTTTESKSKSKSADTELDIYDDTEKEDDFDDGSSVSKEPEADETYSTLKMCRITANRADCWPGDKTDDKFNPSLSALTKGTIAYVTGTSSAYDSDKKETRYFYNLSSGVRILQSAAEIIDETESDNKITASCTATQNNTTIVLDETWHVPYSMTFDPQSYYSGYSVNAFVPTEITFTFPYTTSADGKCDVSSGKLFSSAKWSLNSDEKTAKLTLELKEKGHYYGFTAYYNDSGALVLNFNNGAESLSDAVILLDSGHGGSDSGATNSSGTVRECDINLAETLQLKTELESRGATVYLTKSTDKTMTLDERIAYIYEYNTEIFISVHSNWAEPTTAFGTSIYYYKPMSQPLAKCIHLCMVECYKTSVYPNDYEKQSKVDRGCNYKAFGLTRVEECPSVLLELGFLSNDEECSKLNDSTTRQAFAVAIADGIEDYIKNYSKS